MGDGEKRFSSFLVKPGMTNTGWRGAPCPRYAGIFNADCLHSWPRKLGHATRRIVLLDVLSYKGRMGIIQNLPNSCRSWHCLAPGDSGEPFFSRHFSHLASQASNVSYDISAIASTPKRKFGPLRSRPSW
jgi:hypothetical protein